jgi:hypothetical protein
MALSTYARDLLGLLRTDGHASNLANLKDRLALNQTKFAAAQDELVDNGLAVLAGRGGRIAATPAALLLTALPSDGSTEGNYNVRSRLALDDDTYTQAKRELLAKRLIKVGPGYGGTVARVSAVPPTKAVEEPPQAGLVKLERELYEPFADWLQSSWSASDLKFAEARITATPKGHKRSSGRWSRPDVTAIQVSGYDWLPEITVEVSTYEIKQAADATKLESVYEAAAHGRRAHRASLVVEQAEGRDPVPDPILNEVRRFRLGLYAMRRRSDEGFNVSEIIKPPLTHESQPEEVNEHLGIFLDEHLALRQSYLRAIGR